jgi:hypothetical protein
VTIALTLLVETVETIKTVRNAELNVAVGDTKWKEWKRMGRKNSKNTLEQAQNYAAIG